MKAWRAVSFSAAGDRGVCVLGSGSSSSCAGVLGLVFGSWEFVVGILLLFVMEDFCLSIHERDKPEL